MVNQSKTPVSTGIPTGSIHFKSKTLLLTLSIDNKNYNKKHFTMLTESLFLHVFADNTVFAVTSGVYFLNIQVETEL